MRVIFKQQCACRGQLLAHIGRDQRLKIRAASQRVRVEFGRRRGSGDRLLDAFASLRDHLVVYLFIPNV
jgi:hypothetical protein